MTLNLKEKFLEADSILKNKADSDEVATLIYRTPLVRILLERGEQEGDALSIEVEMSLPETTGMNELDSSELIDRLSQHLQYLQKLREFGFELSVIGTGCVYCASKDIHEIPEDNLFRALIPPETE